MNYRAEGRLEIRITPADVGKRVSVRRVAEIEAGRPVFSDTIGVLTSWADNVLMITRRDGVIVRIAESALVAGKVVPAAAVRRRLAAPAAAPGELQLSGDRCWPAQETEPLGDWRLRAAAGFTRRANSVLALGDPGLPLEDALRRVADWYGDRGLPPYLQVDSDSELAAALTERGLATEARVLVMTSALAPVADAPGAERVTVSRSVDEAWTARYHRTGPSSQAAAAVLSGGPSVWFATVPDPDRPDVPAAIGRCAVDGRWALFGAVEVDPAHRRRGLATAVMAALAGKAAGEGASGAFLQVEADNAVAVALYTRMGFTVVEGYQYHRLDRQARHTDHRTAAGTTDPTTDASAGRTADG